MSFIKQGIIEQTNIHNHGFTYKQGGANNFLVPVLLNALMLLEYNPTMQINITITLTSRYIYEMFQLSKFTVR